MCKTLSCSDASYLCRSYFYIQGSFEKQKWELAVLPPPPLQPGLLHLTPASPGELAASPRIPPSSHSPPPPSSLRLPRLPTRTLPRGRRNISSDWSFVCYSHCNGLLVVHLLNLCHNEACHPLEAFPYSKWLPRVSLRWRSPSLVLKSDQPWRSQRSHRGTQLRSHRQQNQLAACGTAVIKCRSHG
jgi:hypothetical protein